MKFFPKITKKRVFWGIIILGIGLWGYLSSTKDDGNSKYNSVIAKKSDIVQKVEVTGQVKAIDETDLAFEKIGKIAQIYVKVGDKVRKGQVLARLSNADLQAELLQAEANLEREQARLQEAQKGPRVEEINLYRSKVQKSESAIEDAKNTLIDKIREAYTEADHAIRDKTDPLFQNARTNNPQIIFRPTHAQMRIDINNDRFLIGNTLKNWNQSLFSLEKNFEKRAAESKTNCLQIKTFLDDLALATSALSPTSRVSQSMIDIWKTDISIARTSINQAISNLSAAEEKWNTAKNTLVISQEELEFKQAGTRSEQIGVYGAEVRSAKARIKAVQAEIAKTVLRAPISGTVTNLEATPGEIVPLNDVLISIIGERLVIEANVPEIDMARVNIDDPVMIEFDALEDDIFDGKVTFIDPAETVVQGVVYYQVKVVFDQKDSQNVRPGMTADVEIVTGQRENVLVIPQRAVHSKNGDKFVQILKKDEKGKEIVEKTDIKTGLKGSEGEIEVLDGVEVDDRVVVSIKE